MTEYLLVALALLGVLILGGLSLVVPRLRRRPEPPLPGTEVDTRAEASCSTERSSTRCARLRSLSRAGGAITTGFARMLRLVIGPRHRRCSCHSSPRGRLRNPPASSAGHAPAGAETVPRLTLPPDHSVGADH